MEASSLPAPEIEQKLFPRAFQKGRPSAGDPAPGDPPLAPGESTEASDGRTVEAVAGATPPPPSRFGAWSRSQTLAGGRRRG